MLPELKLMIPCKAWPLAPRPERQVLGCGCWARVWPGQGRHRFSGCQWAACGSAGLGQQLTVTLLAAAAVSLSTHSNLLAELELLSHGCQCSSF